MPLGGKGDLLQTGTADDCRNVSTQEAANADFQIILRSFLGEGWPSEYRRMSNRAMEIVHGPSLWALDNGGIVR